MRSDNYLRAGRFSTGAVVRRRQPPSDLGWRQAFVRQDHRFERMQPLFVKTDRIHEHEALAWAKRARPRQIDRPFLFAIEDCHTGLCLFLGQVVDPTAGSTM